ncbi:MAG: hypothetical protein ACRESR_06375 [Gammaproteobacteria bacterium]
MDNLFITRHFDWSFRPRWQIRLFNALLRKLGYSARLVTRTATGRMSSVEQRINIYHLLSQLLVFGVPGDIVEFGSLEGQSAALLRMIADQYDAGRSLHVFDAFVDPPVERLIENFRRLDLALPVIHRGLLEDTIGELPERICFAYIDLGPVPLVTQGPGASHAGLEDAIRLVLERVYPCISVGGIMLLQDYRLPDQTDALDPNPQVRGVADAFFADKPESLVVLHGGPYAHAFMRKLAA